MPAVLWYSENFGQRLTRVRVDKQVTSVYLGEGVRVRMRVRVKGCSIIYLTAISILYLVLEIN